jgi:Fe-S cluster assembly scaffold protein SufB
MSPAEKKVSLNEFADLKSIQASVHEQNVNSEQLVLPEFSETDLTSLAQVGVLTDQTNRSGTYILRDDEQVCSYAHVEGLEVLPIAQALDKYDWVKEKYFWKAVSRDKNKITLKMAEDSSPQGYFIWVKKGAKVEYPYQAALYMAEADKAQYVHNIVVMEENSELHLITGCTTHQDINRGVHMAVSEQFIGKNAKLTNTMVHSWGERVTVRPHAGTVVEEGGSFESNYVSVRTAANVISNPTTWLNGENASAKYFTIVLCGEGSRIESGGNIYLNGKNSSAEILHRGVCTGGEIIQGGLLIGNNACRAHVDCSGMLIDPGENGYIQSTPGLRSFHSDAQMSHEASIGKIAPDQVEYLMSRGMDEREAVSMIIRGFLDAGVDGLSEELDARIIEIAELAGHGEG